MSVNNLKADDVCAFMWARADEASRLNACARAGVAYHSAPLNWYEINPIQRTQIAVRLAEEIATEASIQRAMHLAGGNDPYNLGAAHGPQH